MKFPIRPARRSACLLGQSNGQLPASLLVDIPGQAGGPTIRLIPPAARAWKAMQAAALAAGHVLKATSESDSFRPYQVQEQIFRQRYSMTHIAGRPSRVWQGKTWWQRPNTAAAAVPGTSNHGWGMAVDTGVETDGDAGTESIDTATLDWLLEHAEFYGWSWELESEPWHLHYFAGDDIPAAVLAFEGTHPSPHQEDDDMTDEQAQQLAETRLVVAGLQKDLADIHETLAGRVPGDTTKRSLIGRIGDALKVTP